MSFSIDFPLVGKIVSNLWLLKNPWVKKRGLWSRLLCMVGGFWWKLVLKSNLALKKLWMHGKHEFTKSLKASVPQFRTWLLFVWSTPYSWPMTSAQWSMSLSDACLFTQDIFKDKKTDRPYHAFISWPIIDTSWHHLFYWSVFIDYLWVYSCGWTTFIFYVFFNSGIWFWFNFGVIFGALTGYLLGWTAFILYVFVNTDIWFLLLTFLGPNGLFSGLG